MTKSIRKILACLLSAAVLISVPVTAFAAQPGTVYTEEQQASMMEWAEGAVDQLYSMTDEELVYLQDQGDFAKVASEAVLENREILGDYIGVAGSEIDTGDKDVSVTVKAQFKNYQADLVFTLDGDALKEKSIRGKNLVINPDFPLDIKMQEAGLNFVVGIVLVFVILIFLAIIIWLFKFINKAGDKKDSGKETPQISETDTAADTVGTDSDDELIAVMTAALAAAEASGSSGDGYIVHSIRKIRPVNRKRS